MPGSVTSLFSEPEDLEAALREDGRLGLLIVGRGQFRARLTQLTLHGLRLVAAEEQMARIAFIAVPADMVLILFSTGSEAAPVCGGIEMRAGGIIAIGPGQRAYARTNGLCRWGGIWFPVAELAQYGSVLTGAPFVLPCGVSCWLPPSTDGRRLHQLHAAAIRMAETRPQALLGDEAAHGLEQQLIHALIEGVSAGAGTEGSLAARRHQKIMADFEELIHMHSDRSLRMSEICVALGVSARLLRCLCASHLGIGGNSYIRLRRMSLVRRGLRSVGHDAATVSEVAGRYGFHDLGRFAANYRALFGELPSVTLRRDSGRKLLEPRLHQVAALVTAP